APAAEISAGGFAYSSDTRAPPWRSSRPASSSSSKTTRTIAGELPDNRTRSSIGTGVGPSSVTMRARSPASGSAPGAGASGSSARNSTGWPRIGRSAATTSPASVTSVAPCLMRSFVPSARGSSESGTANTSRPCSSAKRAVISEPERLAASTTTMPAHNPEMSRLRRGKKRARGARAHGVSENKTPPARVGAARATRARGERRAWAAARAGTRRRGGGRGDGAAGEARAMAGGVDAARQAGDDGKPRSAKIARQPLGETQARGRGIAHADDGDRRQTQRGGFAAHGKQRRGVVDHLQPARVFRPSQGGGSDAARPRRRGLAARGLAGTEAGGGGPAPPAG